MIVASAFELSYTKSDQSDLLALPFYRAGKPLQDADKIHPRCYISTRAAGSMRFRWTEENPRRKEFLLKRKILSPIAEPSVFVSRITSASDLYPISLTDLMAVPVELIHSQVVYALEQGENGEPILQSKEGCHPEALDFWRGDGAITTSSKLVPVVTVADCLPIFLYDEKTGCRGVLHSGWKGTGIVVQALKLAERTYGAQPSDFSGVYPTVRYVYEIRVVAVAVGCFAVAVGLIFGLLCLLERGKAVNAVRQCLYSLSGAGIMTLVIGVLLDVLNGNEFFSFSSQAVLDYLNIFKDSLSLRVNAVGIAVATVGISALACITVFSGRGKRCESKEAEFRNIGENKNENINTENN